MRAIERRKNADNRLAELKREKKSLERRLVVAERVIKTNKAKQKEARSRALKLAKSNAKLNKKVAKSERRSSKKRSKFIS